MFPIMSKVDTANTLAYVLHTSTGAIVSNVRSQPSPPLEKFPSKLELYPPEGRGQYPSKWPHFFVMAGRPAVLITGHVPCIFPTLLWPSGTVPASHHRVWISYTTLNLPGLASLEFRKQLMAGEMSPKSYIPRRTSGELVLIFSPIFFYLTEVGSGKYIQQG